MFLNFFHLFGVPISPLFGDPEKHRKTPQQLEKSTRVQKCSLLSATMAPKGCYGDMCLAQGKGDPWTWGPEPPAQNNVP